MLADRGSVRMKEIERENELIKMREQKVFLELAEKDHVEICRVLAHILVRLENIEVANFHSSSRNAIY